MSDFLLNLPDFLRLYLSKEFIVLTSGFFMTIGVFLMIFSLFFSILRINRAMRRDGLEPPALHMINIYAYWHVFSATRKSIANMVKSEQEIGTVKNSFFFNVIPVLPYIKPIDRYISRGFIVSGIIFFAFGFVALFLYPE
ncbi:hypothetical protein [Nitrincola alkalilacustris]|uniref:hypothetical protein n=1 Tax=Nitrincola alkalilacustris TaxID=1571224 RepID=UPI00124CB7B6|nr:hypothetical protein [Nitrincola alkalilacustris]